MAYDLIDLNAYLDHILNYIKLVEYGKITILTGPNGYGKSLLRKLIQVEHEGIMYQPASVSMGQRTASNHNAGALGGLLMDNADDATSNHTCHLIEMLFKSKDDRYMVIDEPEIGLGKEVLLGVIDRIKWSINKKKEEGVFRGIMIITHSEFFIENFDYDVFMNLEGMTYAEWKNREIKAIDPEALANWCLELWRTIEKRIKEN